MAENAAAPGLKSIPVALVTGASGFVGRVLREMRAALGRKRPRLSIPMKALRAAARFGDMAGRVRGRRFFFDSDVLEKLASSAWYNSRKIETELGFKPAYDLEKALPEMVRELGLKVKKSR